MRDGMPQEDDYKQRSPQVKFWQQMYLGLGGAMVFGLVAAVGKGMLEVAGHGAILAGGAPMLAAIGLAGLAVAGVFCLYMGSRFLAESVRMDQEHQAKKICKLIGAGHAQTLTQDAGMGGVVPALASEAEKTPLSQAADMPLTTVSQAVALDRVGGAALQSARA